MKIINRQVALPMHIKKLCIGNNKGIQSNTFCAYLVLHLFLQSLVKHYFGIAKCFAVSDAFGIDKRNILVIISNDPQYEVRIEPFLCKETYTLLTLIP